MTLSDLASIGTLVSGVAVLASLIYLSLQIRQSDKNQRALINQGTVTRNIDILMFLSQPQIHALTTRVAAGEVDFTAEELDYLQLRLRATLLTNQDTFLQHAAGLVDEITFENSLAVMRFVLSQPVYRAIWTTSRGGYAHDWASYIDKQIEGIPLIKPHDHVARFKKVLAAIQDSQAVSSAPRPG
jgi:hypothetical protein